MNPGNDKERLDALVAAMTYPGSRPKEVIERYRHFLSAPLLREVVGNPFRSATSL